MKHENRKSNNELKTDLALEIDSVEFSFESSIKLVDIEDSRVRVKVFQNGAEFLFFVSVSYNFVISYQYDSVALEFTEHGLLSFLGVLIHGNKSSHGLRTIVEAKMIIVKENKIPVQFRDIRLYRRMLIFFKVVPASLSQPIMSCLKNLRTDLLESELRKSTKI